MVKNLNSNLNKNDKFTCDASGCGVKGSPNAVGRGIYDGGPYGDLPYCMNYVNH
jgi:hypothetical protein